jgi:hypothetical protein
MMKLQAFVSFRLLAGGLSALAPTPFGADIGARPGPSPVDTEGSKAGVSARDLNQQQGGALRHQEAGVGNAGR